MENNPLQYIDPTGNSKCAFTETAMECVGNGKGGGGGSASNGHVGSTVVRGNAYAPPPKITRASPNVKFEVSWNQAQSFNKLNIENAMKPKETGKVSGMPPIVQSRINISKDGWKHVVDRHYSDKNASQFTISKDDLRSLLSSKDIVKTPVTRTIDSADGMRYVRVITLDKQVGLDKFNNFQPTSTMTVLTDKYGNLITATPGVIK